MRWMTEVKGGRCVTQDDETGELFSDSNNNNKNARLQKGPQDSSGIRDIIESNARRQQTA